jgi:hypothetical protein
MTIRYCFESLTRISDNEIPFDQAGIALVENLCDLSAPDLLDKRSAPDLRAILKHSLGLSLARQ